MTETSDAYYTAREAIEDFFSDWGHDYEETVIDENNDEWAQHVVMRVFYIRKKDGKVSIKHPDGE